MADKISLIVTQDALKGLDELIAKLNTADQQLNELSNTALNSGKNIGKINSPSSFNQFIQSNVQLNEQLQKQSQLVSQLQPKYEKEAQSINKVSNETAKLLKNLENETKNRQALDKQRQKALQQLEKEQQKLNAAQNLYTKTQQQLNKVTAAYNDLAVRKERYNNLNANEEKRLITLQKVSEKYNTTLKAVDATIGKHQRNVGNYASGFNSLSNSINQLTREAPAFANSIQTGFMALSNNLPIFFDAIGQTQKQIKAMRAEGQQVPGLMSQLATSFLSLGTVLSVGVTLLTLYGDEIVEWASNLFDTSKAIDSVKVSQEQLQDIQKEGLKNAVQEQQSVKMLLETAKDANLSYKEREIAVKQLQEQYPFYFENLSKEQIMAGDTAEAERELNSAIIARAKSQAALTKITENQSKIIDLQFEQEKIKNDLANATSRLEAKVIDDKEKSTDRTRQQIAAAKEYRQELAKQYKSLGEQKQALETVNNTLEEYATSNAKAAAGLDYTSEDTKAKKENIEAIQGQVAESDALLTRLEKQREVLMQLQKEMSNNNHEWEEWQKLINATQDGIDILTGKESRYEKELKNTTKTAIEGLEKQQKSLVDMKKVMEEVEKKAQEFNKSFYDSFVSSTGLSAVFDIANGKLAEFGDNWKAKTILITEAVQQMYNFIATSSQANFDAEKERLEMQKDIALHYAGDSAAAKVKIETEYQERVKEIQRREAKTKQKQALFNIAIDTAQAVMATLGKTGVFGIPLAAVVAAIGAVQMALVASQKIPAFWKGGTHGGGLMMVNDGKGSNFQETIVTPDGKIMQPEGRNVIMDAPKGTKIYTHDQWNEKLNDMLASKGISMKVNNASNMDYERFDAIMGKHLGGRTSQYINFDRNGFSSYISKSGNITKDASNRGSGIGLSV